jgi:hemerythrin-like metal-binding protein
MPVQSHFQRFPGALAWVPASGFPALADRSAWVLGFLLGAALAVQGILRSHQGGIQVLSEVGTGTTFRLLFPEASAAGGALRAREPGSEAHPAQFRGSGMVLVVDDEAMLRAVACRALRHLGFGILEATDGVEAVQVFMANLERIVLIRLDTTMPRMDGEEAYCRLRRAGAMAPIILTSGYGQEEVFRRFRGKGLAGFLQKPYRFQTLVQTVQDALADPADQPPGAVAPAPGRDWIAEFETGDPGLDREHRELLRLFNRLVQAARKPGGDPGRAFADFLQYLAAHFSAEEAWIDQSGYPRAQEHKDDHARLLQQLHELERKFERAEQTFSPRVLNYLEALVFSHVQAGDADLGRHLQAKGP